MLLFYGYFELRNTNLQHDFPKVVTKFVNNWGKEDEAEDLVLKHNSAETIGNISKYHLKTYTS